MRFSFLLLCLLPYLVHSQTGLPALGNWREHLPYQGTIDVTSSETKIYAATPYSFFSVDRRSGEIERFSKVTGLAETGVSVLQYDAQTAKLYVAYQNSNIDVLTATGIRNLPDIKRSTLSGDKNIYALYPDGNRCYVSTGLGVVVLDAEKYEVKESWFIGATGGYVKVNSFVRNGGFFYAATEEGLKRIATTAANPADYRAWQTLSGGGGLTRASAKGVVALQGKTIVLQNDSLFAESNGSWLPFFTNGWPMISIAVSEGKLVAAQRRPNGSAQVIVLNETGTVQRTIQQPGLVSNPRKALAAGGDYWIADLDGGLLRASGNSIENYKLPTPQTVILGDMAVRNGVLWATAGTVNSSWNYQYNPGGIFKFQTGSWSPYSLYSYRQLDSLLDYITVVVDPRDNSAWAGSFGGGLLHITAAGGFEIFKQNSPLLPPAGDPGSYRVSGLAFDAENNLWIANFGSTRQVVVRRANGAWLSFSAPFNLFENAVAQIVVDDAGQKWIQAPQGNGVLVFDEGDFANPGDDRWRQYRVGSGSGNLPSNEVYCLAKDRSGFIWVGTDNGIGVFQCPQEVFSTGCEAIFPVIKEGGFAAYLFRGQEVRSIAVDGADRKWVATASGLWLVSRDGDQVLANYTEQNSPLLSNDVRRVVVDGSTGEVFVATAKGLISFRGGATNYEETKSNVLVFPNPVPPHFSGAIGIRGLPENAVIKITEPGGRLVYQTRSLGGQAVWDGRDYKGTRAASGVYLVLASDADRNEKVVAKIVMISR